MPAGTGASRGRREALIGMVVEAAHRKGRKVEFLAGLGIDSISLNPDSPMAVAQRLAGWLTYPRRGVTA